MSVSTSKYIFGVKILLQQTITEDTDIGLYDNSGVSELRWIENIPDVDLSAAYKDGILISGGIGEIAQEADFTTGGNVAQVQGCSISITGTIDGDPVWEIIRDKGINLLGKTIQIIEFDYSADPATETILRTLVIDKINDGNEIKYSFDCVNPYYKRNTYLSVQKDNGQEVPMLFGEDVLSKLVSEITNITLDLDDCPQVVGSGWGIDVYPIVEKVVSGDGYIVSVAVNRTFYSLPALQSFLDGKTLKIINGGNSGTYRIIDGSLVTIRSVSSFGTCVAVYVEDNEDEIKTYGTIVTSPSTSFCKFLDFSVLYDIDSWKCFGVSDYQIYKLVDDELSARSGFLYRLGNENREIAYYAKFFKDSNNASVFYEMGNAFISSQSASFLMSIEGDTRSMYKISNTWGVYSSRSPDTSYAGANVNPASVLQNYASDRKGKEDDLFHSTAVQVYRLQYGLPQPKAVLLELTNTLNEDQLKNDLYLGINLKMIATLTGSTSGKTTAVRMYASPISIAHDNTILFNSFFIEESATDIVLKSFVFTADGSQEYDFNNIPEDYFDDTSEASTWQKDLFKMPFYHRNNDPYKSNKLGVVFTFIGESDETTEEETTLTLTFKTYELRVIAKQSDSLSQELYSNLSGRIYDDTWSSRKTATALIESPVDVVEHCKRLERNDVDDVDFGLEYSPSVSIDTTTFDSTKLSEIKAMKVARQIVDESDQWSGAITESICKSFFLCSYQDNEGKECIAPVYRDTSTPDVTISFSDIIPDSLSSVEEIGVEDIYCEPFVKYDFNPATKNFDGLIKITNTHKSTFNAAYVTGLEGGEAEHYWNLARALYIKYGTITQPPAEMTDLEWIDNIDDAKIILLKQLEYQGAYIDADTVEYSAVSRKRLSFSVPYDLAMTIGAARKSWFSSMRLAIAFPFHTAGETVNCIVESVSLDVNKDTAAVTVLTYDVTDEIQFYVKDTYGTSDGDDWKDTVQTQTEAPTNGNDIIDSY